MNLDAADFVIKSSHGRYRKNFRIINKEGSTYIATNIRGTEVAFLLSSGFVPVAAREHNEILYLISWKESTKELEIGSFPSPDYTGDLQGNNVYRPLHNLSGNFRTDKFALPTKPTIDLTIQDDYDRSVNLIFTTKGFTPRIVNSKFKVEYDINGNRVYTVTQDRPGNANSNTYSQSSVEKETRLQVSSDKILSVNFNSIQSGGKVKPGNYIYVFYYMTEDFNRSNILEQSSVCQVFFGSTDTDIHGGTDTQETDKRVVLDLFNIDTDFKYLKVYTLYSSGSDTLVQQYLEFTKPILITGTAMQFVHSGFEELAEISQDDLNLDFGIISSADTLEQISGRLLLGGIKEFSYDLAPFRQFADAVWPRFVTSQLPGGGSGAYINPANTYDRLGYMGDESYPFGIVFVLPGGILTPPFPIRGKVFTSTVIYTGPIHSTNDQPVGTPKGIITFPSSNHYLPYESGLVKPKFLNFDMDDGNLMSHGASSDLIAQIRSQSIGFFFVRGERRTTHLAQGLLIPTTKVPAIEQYKEDNRSGNDGYSSRDQGSYFSTFNTQGDDTSVYKFLINLDSLMEAFARVRHKSDGTVDEIRSVGNDFNDISVGYMPIFINDFKAIDVNYIENWYSKASETWARHWAFITGDAFINEPYYVTNLQRETMGIRQLGKVGFKTDGVVNPKFADSSPPVSTALWYVWNTFFRYLSPTTKTIKKISFVPDEVVTTGNDFISKVQFSYYSAFITGGGVDKFTFYRISQAYSSYFGVEMLEGTAGQLADATKSFTNPIGGNNRITSGLKAGNGAETSGTSYSNSLATAIPAAFLVNIYSSPNIPTAAQLYTSLDNVVYKQCSRRYSWDDLDVVGGNVAVFGGDTYISKVSRKLNQSEVKNPNTIQTDDTLRTNIDSGIMVTWWQEAKYNLALRRAERFDASELEDRSFFPYKTGGDFIKYRHYRYPETKQSSPGYSQVTLPKSFFSVPEDAPFIENEFFSRVYASDRHIPSAFINGFRKITNNFKDYTSSLGRIIKLFNHRGNLVIIFEHGIGTTSVEQRVQTAGDAAGAIFVEPGEVLPVNLQYYSQEIGAQNLTDVIQTPSALYGIDRARRVIWQIRDTLRSVSDGQVASFLDKNSPVNMRLAFDPAYSEVLFTSDNWTLVFTEGIEEITSFYSFRPSFYARRAKDMYSFAGSQFHKHDSQSTFQIYGQNESAFVEIVVNQSLGVTKVLDYITIISNAVPPSKVEVFTYNQATEKIEVLNTAQMNQYLSILNENDRYTGSPKIKYKDKRYSVKIPAVQIYNSSGPDDKWTPGGRMRNIYFVIRLTYDTTSLVQLASVISDFRQSFS